VAAGGDLYILGEAGNRLAGPVAPESL
jgi:hypothetical protein